MNLEITILRKGHRQDVIHIDGDPDDVAAAQAALVGWLEGHKWHPGRWNEFEAEVRPDGRGRPVAKVRA